VENLFGKHFIVMGVVEEHLSLGENNWIKLRLPDNSSIMINVIHCKEINDHDNGKSSKQD
jgi:hypothetical protein